MNSFPVFKFTSIIPLNDVFDEFIISDDIFSSISNLKHPVIQDNVSGLDVCQNNSALISSNSDAFSNKFFNSCRECHQSVAFMKFQKAIKVKIDIILYYLLILELKNSDVFRKSFLRNIYTGFARGKKFGVYYSCTLCGKCNESYHIITYLNFSYKDKLDLAWNKRMQYLVIERCELENAMAWLSTLGGAFSALGDTYVECAIKAGAISIHQLRIALRLGDPLTVCRCKIYLAMSHLQQGYFKRTQTLIRELYKFSTEGEGARDFRLKNMCIAVWNRLKYLKSQRAIKANHLE